MPTTSESFSSTVKGALKSSLRQIGSRPFTRRVASVMGIRSARAGDVSVANVELPGTYIAYFGDGADKIYQLDMWLPVLELVHEKHGVLLVFRTASAFKAAKKLTHLPMVFVRRFASLMDIYDDNSFRLVMYVNNSRSNFQSLEHPRLVHVHVNHGESDKLSMVSNKAKAYDRVFVAGPAAIARHEAMLIDFDLQKLVVTGRPQLDIGFAPEIAASNKFDVMYAPTWEGESEDNNYTSLDLYGESIVDALLRDERVRLIYKPHPRVEESNDAGVAAAHAVVMEKIAARNAEGAEHIVEEQGNILAMFESVDALITDVSSVGLDFLYLHPSKPMVLTDRRSHIARLHRDVPVSKACRVIDADCIAEIDDLLQEALHEDTFHRERYSMREYYFGKLRRGDSTVRFQSVLENLVTDRNEQLKHYRQWHA